MDATKQFQDFGYIVLKDLVPSDEAKNLYDYTLKKVELGNMDDGQVPGSPAFYQDNEVVKLQKKLTPYIEEKIAIKLKPVFCYNRIYRKGAVLRMHKDSVRAEISATINLGYQGQPWDLWLVDYAENAQRITLSPGDALIYYGNRLHHWRGKLVDGDLVSQVMFHFVDRNGKHALSANWEIIVKLRRQLRKLRGIAY